VSTRITVAGRRTCALMAACSTVLHGVSLGHVANAAAAVLMMAMAAACLYCAGDLWIRGTSRAWAMVASMNLAMIAVHLPLASGHHHGGGINAGAAVPGSTVMTLATTLALIEVVVATAVLYVRTCSPQAVFHQSV
jgi:hypothetical protein